MNRPLPIGSPPRYAYSLVKGVFVQDEDAYVPTANQLQPRLGLAADTWPDVQTMNATAPKGTIYKLIFAGRHGQGFHNVAIAKYTSNEWRNKCAMRNGDGELTWGPDPKLTRLGIEQAETARGAWLKVRPPAPEAFYCSPHRRALKTCQITFPNRRVKVLEDIREKLSGHTCDFRLPISEIRNKFPNFDFSSFESDGDPYALTKPSDADIDQETLPAEVLSRRNGHGLVVESELQTAERVRRVLDFLFDHEPAHVISITAHAGWIRGLLDVTGRHRFQLQTGGITPFLIKAVRIRSEDDVQTAEHKARDAAATLGIESVASVTTGTAPGGIRGPELHRTGY
ncbi:phosphoglycerate mutase-like protein [Auriculariales sp. MPI-PUGE-AT-0066]|nr:phosphoglycerate mutase-like protein [Auriculariales sp. MPI-PUGE-AT-0066]